MVFSFSFLSPSEAWALLNGHLALENEYPAVVRLDLNGGIFCSGVYIAPRVVLTSAHCAYADVKIKGKTVKKIHKHPKYKGDESFSEDPYDIAFLEVTLENAWLPMATQSVRVGEPVTLVGYGRTSPNIPSDGFKRFGKNEIYLTDWGQILLETYADEPKIAALLPGDSGGPLLNFKGEVVGIASFGAYEAFQYKLYLSKYVDVASPDIQSFLITSQKAYESLRSMVRIRELFLYSDVEPPQK